MRCPRDPGPKRSGEGAPGSAPPDSPPMRCGPRAQRRPGARGRGASLLLVEGADLHPHRPRGLRLVALLLLERDELPAAVPIEIDEQQPEDVPDLVLEPDDAGRLLREPCSGEARVDLDVASCDLDHLGSTVAVEVPRHADEAGRVEF